MRNAVTLIFLLLFPLLIKAQEVVSRFESRTELEANAPWGYGLRTITGYKITNHWSVGIGVGYNDHPDQLSIDHSFNFNYSTLPVFFELKYNIKRNNHSIYIYADAGYSVLLSHENLSGKDSTYSAYGMSSETDVYTASLGGGFTGSCGVGYALYISPKIQWTFNVAFDFIGVHENDIDNKTFYYYYLPVFPYIQPGPPDLVSDNAFWGIGFGLAIRTGFIF